MDVTCARERRPSRARCALMHSQVAPTPTSCAVASANCILSKEAVGYRSSSRSPEHSGLTERTAELIVIMLTSLAAPWRAQCEWRHLARAGSRMPRKSAEHCVSRCMPCFRTRADAKRWRHLVNEVLDGESVGFERSSEPWKTTKRRLLATRKLIRGIAKLP